MGRSDINPRGDSLLEYLASLTFGVLNLNNEPTSEPSNWKEVTEMTLWTNEIEIHVRNCHISDEPSSSNHR
jgi:hypothetical protein